jgi:hypothetical protein
MTRRTALFGEFLSLILAGALCVDVKIDRTAYLDCLNEMFRAAAAPVRPEPAPNPAAAPAPAVGTFNQSALRETLGQAFGHSVVPARPAQASPGRLAR